MPKNKKQQFNDVANLEIGALKLGKKIVKARIQQLPENSKEREQCTKSLKYAKKRLKQAKKNTPKK